MDNIQAFDAACAAILSDLYDSFPRPKLLDCATLPILWPDLTRMQATITSCAGDAQLQQAAQGDYQAAKAQHTALLENATATVQFLSDEGFIRFNERSGHRFSQVQLTSQGLGALRKTPDTLHTNNPSIAQRIKEAINTGQAVGGIITMLLSAIK